MLSKIKSNLSIIFVFFGVVFISNNANASIFGWNLGASNKNDPNSEYHKRLPLAFKDDVTSDQDSNKIKLTDAQKHQALVWGLSDQQEKRFVFLMQNRSGNYFKNTKLTPVEILGINARTDEERMQYAVIDAKQEFEKNAKILSFNTDYDMAATALKNKLNLPVIRKFNYAKYSPYNYKPVQLKANDKLMLFVKRNENVKPIVSYLMSEIESNPSVQLNVYFIDNEKSNKGKTIKITKSDIVHWAQEQNIPSTMVNDRLITLNFDNGQYASVNAKGGINIKDRKTPLLILVHDGQSRVVDTGRF